MSKGLEIFETSSVNYKDRFDSEYFLKKYIQVYSLINKNNNDDIHSLGLVTDGNHLTIAESYADESGVRYLRGQDISGDFLTDSNSVFIPQAEYDKLKRSHIFCNDVLVTIVGANTGQTAIVVNPPEKLTANCKLGIVRVTNNAISQLYLHVFLASKYGQYQIKRLIRGGGQTGLILPDFRSLKIVRFSSGFEKLISNISVNVYRLIDLSRELYSHTETILLQELGEFESRSDLGKVVTAVKTLKNSFEDSGRFDAEYYQPKYTKIEYSLKQYKYGWDVLENVFTIHDTNVKPKDNVVYKYIELADIGSSGDVTGCTETVGIELPSRARRRVHTNQLLVSSIEGSLQSCALVPSEYDNGLCSTGFYVVSSDIINPETSLVLFKSKPIQAFMKKICSGTILTAMTKEEFKLLPIPIVDKKVQAIISEKVQESFKLRKQSKMLLEAAKKAVEIAIEENEAAAIKYLNNIGVGES